MSKEDKDLRVGVVSILVTIFLSLLGTIWYTAEVFHQVEVNTEHLYKVDMKLMEMSKIIFKDKK